MKPVYKASSDFRFFLSVVLRFTCLVGLVYLYYIFDDNQRLETVATISLALVFFISGNTEIIIYPGKVVEKTNSFASMILPGKEKQFEISEIKKAYLPEDINPGVDELTAVAVLAALLPGKHTNYGERWNVILLEMNDGKTVRLFAELSKRKREKAVAVINSLLPANDSK